MTYNCSQCSFTAQFESALMMHQQLHHGNPSEKVLDVKKEKSKTMLRSLSPLSTYSLSKYKGSKLLNRTSSATRLFDKLRARICRSKTMLTHPEESLDNPFNDLAANDTSLDIISDCTSKALNIEPSRTSALTIPKDTTETYSCHLCTFDADRITVLDRHLLNDHKIGLESLLKLVMAKTREGLNESPGPAVVGARQPYYKGLAHIMEEGEFVIETTAPKIKILKHASTNTEAQWNTMDIPNLKDDCRMITKQLEQMISNPSETCDKEDFLVKMQTLNEYMCKFVNSSNTLKKTLNKEFGSKHRLNLDQSFFDLSLGDRDTPRDWERAHSEKIDRARKKYGDNSRGDKKLEAESFYF